MECATCPSESCKIYGIGVAVPEYPDTGVKFTVPLAFTVYVPSPVTVIVVFVHEGAISGDSQSNTVVASNG